MSLIIAGGTTTLISFIGKDIILKTINQSCSSIIILLNYLIYDCNNFYEIKQKLELLDINNKISVINLIIEENIEKYSDKKSINLVFNSIKEILEQLNNELSGLKNKIEDNKQLYFSYFRKINLNTEIKSIENHNNILDKRFDLLIKSIKI